MNCTPWQKGDLALCVRSPRIQPGKTQVGRIYQVERVWVHPIGLALAFVGVDNGAPRGRGFYGHAASRFRKIEPHTPDEEDAETIRLLTGANVGA